MSALLSKAGLQTEKKACALADYLNIAIQFDEFSKVGWGCQVQGAYRAANHYILVVVYCAQGHCTTFMIISLRSPPGKKKTLILCIKICQQLVMHVLDNFRFQSFQIAMPKQKAESDISGGKSHFFETTKFLGRIYI